MQTSGTIVFNWIAFAIIHLAIGLSAGAASAAAVPIRFDGLYCARTSSGCTEFMRFYPDGTLVIACSTGNARQVARWLRKDYSWLGEGGGTYRIVGNKLKARTSVHAGKPGRTGSGWIDYTGSINGNSLLLRIHSHLTGHRETLRLEFVKVRFGHAAPNPSLQRTAGRSTPHTRL